MAEGDQRFQISDGGSPASFITIPMLAYRHTRRASGIHDAKVLLPGQYDKSGTITKTFTDLDGDIEARIQRENSGGSWETLFGGWTQSGGRLKNDGTIELFINGYGYKAIREKVNPSFSSSAENDTIMSELWGTVSESAGFSVQDASAAGATTYTISNYSLNDERKAGVDELSRNYRWTVYIDHDTSDYTPGNSSNTVKYEPTGFTASGESIDTSTDASAIREWEFNRFKDNIGTVRAIGTDTNNNKISADSGSGDPFVRVHVGYAESTSELQDVADQIAGTGSGDGGKVVTNGFVSSIVNETIQLTDSLRNINDTFVVKKQVNEWAGNLRTTLELGFSEEGDGIGRISQRERELRRERSRVITQSSTDVGGQGLTSAATGSDSANLGKTGGVNDGGTSSLVEDNDGSGSADTFSASTWTTMININPSASETQGIWFHVSISANPTAAASNEGEGKAFKIATRIVSTASGNFPSANGSESVVVVRSPDASNYDAANITFEFFLPEDTSSDIYSVEINPTEEIFTNWEVVWWTFAQHDHPDDINFSDSGHSDHGVTGTTDSKNVNTGSEDKDDR